jgi:hypothetical protein
MSVGKVKIRPLYGGRGSWDRKVGGVTKKFVFCLLPARFSKAPADDNILIMPNGREVSFLCMAGPLLFCLLISFIQPWQQNFKERHEDVVSSTPMSMNPKLDHSDVARQPNNHARAQ